MTKNVCNIRAVLSQHIWNAENVKTIPKVGTSTKKKKKKKETKGFIDMVSASVNGAKGQPL